MGVGEEHKRALGVEIHTPVAGPQDPCSSVTSWTGSVLILCDTLQGSRVRIKGKRRTEGEAEFYLDLLLLRHLLSPRWSPRGKETGWGAGRA